MSRTQPRTDFFRACVSTLAAMAVAAASIPLLIWAVDVDFTGSTEALITTYVVFWPLYSAIYVGWGVRVYSRLDPAQLKALATQEERGERRRIQRMLGMTGTTNTTVSAATVAVVVTILIAQRPEFRDEAIYVALALLTVASSWVLMVFAFAQAYLRLEAASKPGTQVRFPFTDAARFGDYFTLAVLLSTMAATVSARIASRAAWNLVRVNVVIAFTFNSVIIAMMVSLVFGGLAS